MGEKKRWEEWEQQSFNFEWTEDPKPAEPKKKYKRTDYELLYKSLLQGPLSFSQIGQIAGIDNRSSISQIITTLSLKFPVYEAQRGIYKLYGDDDYGDGINHSALQQDADEW